MTDWKYVLEIRDRRPYVDSSSLRACEYKAGLLKESSVRFEFLVLNNV
jgi:hypothetical protein